MDNQTRNKRAAGLGLLVLFVALAASAYLASGKTIDVEALLGTACDKPIQYTIGTFDERFGISRSEFNTALAEAASVWNEAAGKTVVTVGTENAVAVNLVYSEYQRNAQLGQSIDAEQQAYEDKRDEVEDLRNQYQALRTRFATEKAAFDRTAKEYDKDVAYWNARGGAPPEEYQKLEREKAQLAVQQEELNELVAEVNAMAKRMNTEVDELNRLAARTNAKVGVYNKRAGTDFDQGTYTEDANGKRIDIYEFTDRMELKRVLAHELGHALGFLHVENPESIMYSYNIGETFALSEEDRAALAVRCGVE
ncbi:MAG: matrixin family metalloprotease [Patescibacteria group bacterium]